MITKTTLILFSLLLLIGAVVAWVFYSSTPTTAVNSFDTCVAAGYPVLESYPEQCLTPDGTTYNRNIQQPDNNLPSRGQNDLIDYDDAIACTMDALECPDGSFVGRIPPSCEFAPCPGNQQF